MRIIFCIFDYENSSTGSNPILVDFQTIPTHNQTIVATPHLLLLLLLLLHHHQQLFPSHQSLSRNVKTLANIVLQYLSRKNPGILQLMLQCTAGTVQEISHVEFFTVINLFLRTLSCVHIFFSETNVSRKMDVIKLLEMIQMEMHHSKGFLMELL